LLNSPRTAGEAELVLQEENQAPGAGERNARDSQVPGGARAEPLTRFLFCRDPCKPKPLSGMNLGADLKAACSAAGRASI